ncbi:MAG: hypothetical protein ABI580_13275 [Burkholderiaceae bacterium]
MIAVTLLIAAMLIHLPAHSAEKVGAARAEARADLAQLERGFWICDHLVTKQAADIQQAGTCSANFEALKETKFGGDFEKLLAWWRVNKAAQHKALESIDSAQ